jgi:hypothetical protein
VLVFNERVGSAVFGQGDSVKAKLIDLHECSFLNIKIIDESNQPIEGAEVTSRHSDLFVRKITDRDGIAFFDSIDVQSYILVIEKQQKVLEVAFIDLNQKTDHFMLIQYVKPKPDCIAIISTHCPVIRPFILPKREKTKQQIFPLID